MKKKKAEPRSLRTRTTPVDITRAFEELVPWKLLDATHRPLPPPEKAPNRDPLTVVSVGFLACEPIKNSEPFRVAQAMRPNKGTGISQELRAYHDMGWWRLEQEGLYEPKVSTKALQEPSLQESGFSPVLHLYLAFLRVSASLCVTAPSRLLPVASLPSTLCIPSWAPCFCFWILVTLIQS